MRRSGFGMLRRAAYLVPGIAYISAYHADARASSHVNLEIVTCATGFVITEKSRDAARREGAKRSTPGRAGFERTRHAHGGRQTPRRTERKASSGPDPLVPITKIKTRTVP